MGNMAIWVFGLFAQGLAEEDYKAEHEVTIIHHRQRKEGTMNGQVLKHEVVQITSAKVW